MNIDLAMNEHLHITRIRKQIKVSTSYEPAITQDRGSCYINRSIVHIDPDMNEHVHIMGIEKKIKVSASCDPTIAQDH